MKIFVKILALAIPVLGVGVLMSILDHKEPVNQSYDGWVSYLEWESKNHGMPLIEIKRENGTVKKFHNPRIILKPEQVKVGDKFSKVKNSTVCQINKKEVPCLK